MQLPTACPLCGNSVVGSENSEVTNYRKENGAWSRKKFLPLHCINFRTEPPAGSTLNQQSLASNLYCLWKTDFRTEPETNISDSEAPKIDLSVKYNPIDRSIKSCVRCKKNFTPDWELQTFCGSECQLIDSRNEHNTPRKEFNFNG